MPKVNMIDVLFIFVKLDVGCFYHFGWFVRILFSDKNQTIIFFFILGKVMDENLIFSWRLDTSEYPEIFFFHQQNPAILIFLTKCNFKNFMLWKWKFPIFEKQLFHSIKFPFIHDFTWNIDEINDFWRSGLWWPFLAFIGLFGLCGLGWFFKAKTGLCW